MELCRRRTSVWYYDLIIISDVTYRNFEFIVTLSNNLSNILNSYYY